MWDAVENLVRDCSELPETAGKHSMQQQLALCHVFASLLWPGVCCCPLGMHTKMELCSPMQQTDPTSINVFSLTTRSTLQLASGRTPHDTTP